MTENDVPVVIIDSRGRDVVNETLVKDFDSPVIVDGWGAYSYLRTMQRRWSHLIWEVDAFTNTDHGRELSDEIHNMPKELKESPKSENMDERKSMKGKFDTGMERTVKRYDPYEELHKPVEYTRNGLGSWFT